MKRAETQEEAKAESELVKELTGQIIARAEANGWSREELAQRAKKKSASTLYGWRNGSRKNPSLLDLQAFAAAVGLSVRLIGHDALADTEQGPLMNTAPGGNLTSEMRQMIGIMQTLSEQGQRDVVQMVMGYAKTWGVPANPLEADVAIKK